MPKAAPAVTITVEPPSSTDSQTILRRYYEDIIARYYGRDATSAEVDETLTVEPSAGLEPPTGLFLIARRGAELLGCAGIRIVAGGNAEVTKVFVSSGARGLGIARQLLGELEREAGQLGIDHLRLTVRTDLTEARRLYAALGYVDIAPFSNEPYADHWLGKDLHAPQQP